MSATVRSHPSGRSVWRPPVLGVAIVLAGFSAAAQAQTVTFARDDNASFAGARSIVSADFNRDGWPDVAHANGGRNSVTILLGYPHDGLSRAADTPVGATPFDLTSADFNRDGIPDLAMANADSHSISVLLGRGDASFTRSDIAAPAANPRGITAADVNHDGKPDLIYSGFATGRVQVLVGDGAGGFRPGVAFVSAALQPQGMATADFNHDGHLDVAVAYASATGLRILYGDGGTGFTARTVAGAANLNVVAVGDVNRDGWEDVAAASTAGSTVAIYHGSAAGLVHTQTAFAGSSPRGIDLGDVNGDGLLDVVTANRASSTVSVLLGDSAHPGTFLAHVDVASGSGSRDAVVADFDADGRLDIASGNEYAASATVLLNRTFLVPPAYAFRRVSIGDSSAPAPIFNGVWSADFNRDGRLDVVTIGAEDWSAIVLLTGGRAIALPGNPRAVADLNGDGNPDVLYAVESGGIGAHLGDGRGGFVTAPTTAWAGLSALAIGDMNRDGRPDLATVGSDAPGRWVLQVGLGRGDGTFGLPSARVVLPDHATGIALADVNRDGRPDVVALQSNFSRGLPNEARVWFGTGVGGLTATSWGATFVSRFGVQFDVADVNHDGFVDVVASDFQQMAVALGSATGFAAPVFTQVTSEEQFPGAVSIGDLNVDGNLDVAFGSGAIMLGNGDGTFVSGGRFDYGDAGAVRLVDFTRDGLPDIVASPSDRGVVVLANTRDRVNQLPTVEAGPDHTIAFGATQGEDCNFWVTPAATDPDAHWLTYEWRRDGAVITNAPTVFLCGPPPGTYVYSVTVRDGRGAAATDRFTVTIPSIKEIVLWAADAGFEGRWMPVDDQTAAGGVRAYDPNLGAPKVTAPVTEPASRVTLRFYADPNETYKLWIRLKGDANSWTNDSVWVQFRGATDPAGVEKYQVGTSSGLSVSLEECSGCGISGWGWEDDGWGAFNKNGGLLRFPQDPDRDPKYIVIQTREDGVSIDQIVLSAEKYLTARPGKAKNDTTILPRASSR
jgi:hypothetical protein